MNPPTLNLTARTVTDIGKERFKLVEISNLFGEPEVVIEQARISHFERINEHYPGVRAPVSGALLSALCTAVRDIAEQDLGLSVGTIEGDAWFSIVTREPGQLTPIQRLPHFDGFDETQLALMIYLNRTDHGGTAFYRQRSTGLERVCEADFPAYRQSLENDVRAHGLPAAQYMGDGAPIFERIAASSATFNSAIIYPGNALHSGVIDNTLELSPDPTRGRLTINGFFRPAG